jgi:predicted RNA-binding Zn-ribbon protein involved in translation (DUF1610 family)
MKYVAPVCGKDGFTCPNCGAYAQQKNWAIIRMARGHMEIVTGNFLLG